MNIEDFRNHCLSLKEVSEEMPLVLVFRPSPSLRVKLYRKNIVLVFFNEHNITYLRLCRCEPIQSVLYVPIFIYILIFYEIKRVRVSVCIHNKY